MPRPANSDRRRTLFLPMRLGAAGVLRCLTVACIAMCGMFAASHAGADAGAGVGVAAGQRVWVTMPTPQLKYLGDTWGSWVGVTGEPKRNAAADARRHVQAWAKGDAMPQADEATVILDLIGYLQLTPLAEDLARVDDRLLAEGKASRRVREHAIRALARVRPREKGLDELDRAMHDEALALHTRCEAAAALVMADDERGREFLMAAYRTYLEDIATKSQWNSSPRDVLQTMHDRPLMAEIEAVGRGLGEGTPRNNVTTLLTTMRINAAPLPQLRQWAKDESWEQANRRYDAVTALAGRGERGDLALLDDLPRWESDAPEHQQEMLAEHGHQAARAIRLRLAGRRW